MGLEMTGEVGDALGEDRNLHFRRTGIAGLEAIVLDERFLALGRDRHRKILSKARRRAGRGGKNRLATRIWTNPCIALHVGPAGMSSRRVSGSGFLAKRTAR